MPSPFKIRLEKPEDVPAISQVHQLAFTDHPHSEQNEHRIVTGLRDADALTLSLVATEEGKITGHLAFSRVQIDGVLQAWYGLGPVAVLPDRQGRGVGTRLIEEGLSRLKADGGAGCVLVGEPSFYGRFGFFASDRLRYPGIPTEYFLVYSFSSVVPTGIVSYHPAFYLDA